MASCHRCGASVARRGRRRATAAPQHRKAAKRARRAARDTVVPYDLGLLAVLERQAVGITR